MLVRVYKLRLNHGLYFILVCVLILIFYLTNDDEEFVGVASLLVPGQVLQDLPLPALYPDTPFDIAKVFAYFLCGV